MSKVWKIVIKSRLDCYLCTKKINKAICSLCACDIESKAFDEKENTVTLTGTFDPEKVMRKMCRKACKAIISYEIIEIVPPKDEEPKKEEKPDTGEKAKTEEKPEEKPAEAKAEEKAVDPPPPEEPKKEEKSGKKKGKNGNKMVVVVVPQPSKAAAAPPPEVIESTPVLPGISEPEPEPVKAQPPAPPVIGAPIGWHYGPCYCMYNYPMGYDRGPCSCNNRGRGQGYYGNCHFFSEEDTSCKTM